MIERNMLEFHGGKAAMTSVLFNKVANKPVVACHCNTCRQRDGCLGTVSPFANVVTSPEGLQRKRIMARPLYSFEAPLFLHRRLLPLIALRNLINVFSAVTDNNVRSQGYRIRRIKFDDCGASIRREGTRERAAVDSILWN